jgi:uncharacterized protein YndB with AHSA1/START domain
VDVFAETFLPAAPERVWPLVTFWEGQARWMRDADRVRVLTSHREGVGVLLAVRTRVLNLPLFTERLEVTVWEPPRRLVVAHRSLVRGLGEWTCAEAPGGTRFRWSERISLPAPPVGEVLLRLYRPFMRRTMQASLGNFQALVRTEVT